MLDFHLAYAFVRIREGRRYMKLKLNKLYAALKWCRSDVALLTFVWSVGMILGICTGSEIDRSLFSLMLPNALDRVSIVGHFIAVFLPFLLSGFVVDIHAPKLLLPIAFFKVYSFSLVGSLIFGIYKSAGWLVSLLVQFSDILLMPVLFWYCLRNVSGKNPFPKRDTYICLFIAAVVACFDYFVVSPFFAKLSL